MKKERELTPREIVAELDRYIVGQAQAKRAVAIAMRNRWRRMQIEGPIKEEIYPKNILGRYEKSKEEIAKAQLEMISTAIEAFRLDTGRYPNSLDELINCQDPKCRAPYLAKKEIPKDPWGRDYVYKYPGEHGPYDLYSLGPDGQLNEKAITNWSK